MVYKIGNKADIAKLPLLDKNTMELLYHHARLMSHHYGEDRDVDNSDGGIVLFAPTGTDSAELKAFFDVSSHTPEYINTYGDICEAIYITDNEYAIVIIMSISDAPDSILNEID